MIGPSERASCQLRCTTFDMVLPLPLAVGGKEVLEASLPKPTSVLDLDLLDTGWGTEAAKVLVGCTQ